MTKITRATIKSFIKREAKNGNLYVKQESTFDGMVDCVMPTADNFRKVDTINEDDKNTLGIAGFWLVGGNRDYYKKYEDGKYTGYEVSNPCGSCLIAIPKTESEVIL